MNKRKNRKKEKLTEEAKKPELKGRREVVKAGMMIALLPYVAPKVKTFLIQGFSETQKSIGVDKIGASAITQIAMRRAAAAAQQGLQRALAAFAAAAAKAKKN